MTLPDSELVQRAVISGGKKKAQKAPPNNMKNVNPAFCEFHLPEFVHIFLPSAKIFPGLFYTLT